MALYYDKLFLCFWDWACFNKYFFQVSTIFINIIMAIWHFLWHIFFNTFVLALRFDQYSGAEIIRKMWRLCWLSVGRKRKKSRRWWRIRRRGPRGMLPGQPRERPIISVDREGRIKAPIFGAVLDRWSRELLLFSSRARNALHVSSSDRALSFASDSIGMGTVALDRGMLLRWPDRSRSRRRRWAWTINRLRSSSCKTAGFAGGSWGTDETLACGAMRLTNCGSRNEIFFFSNN